MQRDQQRPKIQKIKDGVFAQVIRSYQASGAFRDLGSGTRANYSRILRMAERPEILGALSIYEIRPALVQAFLDGLANTPGTQALARTVLSAIQRYALVRDLLPYPITTGTKCIEMDGGHVHWSDAQVAIGQQHAKDGMERVITLMVNTGQRGSDVCRMRLSDIEEQHGRPGINVIQKKTGLRLWVPMTAELREAIEEWRPTIRPPWHLVTKPDGQPYTRPQLSHHWTTQKASIPEFSELRGLVLHGLRGTCVVRLRRAGASVLQICSMVGMSEPMVSRYSRYADQRDMALAAVHFLDGTPREQVQTARSKIKPVSR